MSLFLVYTPKGTLAVKNPHWLKETMNENGFHSIFMGEKNWKLSQCPSKGEWIYSTFHRMK